MNLGVVTKLNEKGQIVIPKEYRKNLSIDSNALLNLIMRGRGIYIYPITDIITEADKENSYINILKKTQGSWEKESWQDLRKKRRKIEINASKTRKRVW